MNLETKNINNLRILAVDMIENARSGHPGIALGSAPTLYTLYSKHMNVVPDDDKNILRDRFVLSAGHGSSILYATLHAFGYKISIDDLKNFRKYQSKTPGHPECDVVPGVDASTGPLGQGVATAVGLALGQRLMASKFNKPDLTLFDNYTYTLCGEGCLMEGVSYEALSLAGTLKLNKLIVLYDCNRVTLDGDTNGVMDMNVSAYMKSLGFNVIEVKDGNDVDEISGAIADAKKSKDKPSFIIIHTHIGYGSVYQDSNKSHGSILGAENVETLRNTLGVSTKPFELDKDVARDFVFLRKRFESVKKTFKEKLKAYSRAYPGDYKLLKKLLNNELDFAGLKDLKIDKNMSGRDMGGLVLNEIAKNNFGVLCNSADLFSSTKAMIKDSGYINTNFGGRNLKAGIREFAMGAISNGISLYGGLTPVQSTFMVFSDYLKPAIRLGALMNARVVSAFTHDSIAVGEDGPTHQPIEQLWSLRSIPKCVVYRPANLQETIASYMLALEYSGQSILALSRQNLTNFDSSVDDALMGGYILQKEGKGALNGVIIATGSEVGMALDIARVLDVKGYNVRVVSMPSVEIFEMQSEKYRNSIIPKNLKSVFTIEAGATSGWFKYAGKYGKCFGVDDFGMSASPEYIYNHFHLTIDDISKEMIRVIRNNGDKIMSLV